jgi:hypothetical protein
LKKNRGPIHGCDSCSFLQERVQRGDLVFVETPPQGIAALAGTYHDDSSLTRFREDIYLARDAEPMQ